MLGRTTRFPHGITFVAIFRCWHGGWFFWVRAQACHFRAVRFFPNIWRCGQSNQGFWPPSDVARLPRDCPAKTVSRKGKLGKNMKCPSKTIIPPIPYANHFEVTVNLPYYAVASSSFITVITFTIITIITVIITIIIISIISISISITSNRLTADSQVPWALNHLTRFCNGLDANDHRFLCSFDFIILYVCTPCTHWKMCPLLIFQPKDDPQQVGCSSSSRWEYPTNIDFTVFMFFVEGKKSRCFNGFCWGAMGGTGKPSSEPAGTRSQSAEGWISHHAGALRGWSCYWVIIKLGIRFGWNPPYLAMFGIKSEMN